MPSVIDLLHSKHLIWQGSKQQEPINTQSTGYPELDAQLDGGFPIHGVVEICSELGIGELRLLTPFIKASGKKKLSVFINPPAYLCSEYLDQQGIDLHRLITIFPKTEKEALWATEQSLKSGCCSSVILWHPCLQVHQARRLQVASETGQCLNFLFKTEQHEQVSLPISLTMQLQAEESGIQATIHKRKGGWKKSTFSIDMSHKWAYLRQQAKSLPTSIPTKKQDNIALFPLQRRG